MNNRNIISISEARKKIFEIAETVQRPDTYYILTEKGKAKVVILSMNEFESWEETLSVIQSDSTVLTEVIRLKNDITTQVENKYITLEHMLEKQGFALAEKNSKYETRNTNKSKRRK